MSAAPAWTAWTKNGLPPQARKGAPAGRRRVGDQLGQLLLRERGELEAVQAAHDRALDPARPGVGERAQARPAVGSRTP